jgi:ribbon-helix-helix CopG family protein
MRTTIRLDDDLLSQAKQLAAATGRTLTAVIEDALRAQLARRADPRRRVKLPVFHGGGGLQPGVDLDNNAALLELLESEPDPS